MQVNRCVNVPRAARLRPGRCGLQALPSTNSNEHNTTISIITHQRVGGVEHAGSQQRGLLHGRRLGGEVLANHLGALDGHVVAPAAAVGLAEVLAGAVGRVDHGAASGVLHSARRACSQPQHDYNDSEHEEQNSKCQMSILTSIDDFEADAVAVLAASNHGAAAETLVVSAVPSAAKQ